MTVAVRHTGIVVQDATRALALWRDLLGFELVREMDESGPFIDRMMGLEGVAVQTIKLRAPGGGMIELLCFASHPDAPRWEGRPYSTGITHVALTVSGIDALRGQLEEHGFSFLGDIQRSPDGTVKVAYCQGPDGVLLELVEES